MNDDQNWPPFGLTIKLRCKGNFPALRILFKFQELDFLEKQRPPPGHPQSNQSIADKPQKITDQVSIIREDLPQAKIQN
jgi:hypothetical protein